MGYGGGEGESVRACFVVFELREIKVEERRRDECVWSGDGQKREMKCKSVEEYYFN